MSAAGHKLECLTGAKAIAQFLNLTERQVFHHAESGCLPVFRMGRTLCARPATLLAWIAEQEAEANR